jgi:hypothetical protein
VPVAAVYEYRQPSLREDNVSCPSQGSHRAVVDPIAKSRRMEKSPDREFRLRITRPVTLHDSARAGDDAQLPVAVT